MCPGACSLFVTACVVRGRGLPTNDPGKPGKPLYVLCSVARSDKLVALTLNEPKLVLHPGDINHQLWNLAPAVSQQSRLGTHHTGGTIRCASD